MRPEFFEKLYLVHGFNCRWLFRPDKTNRISRTDAFVNKVGGNCGSGSTQAALAMHGDGKFFLTANVNKLNNCLRLLDAGSQPILDW